jgi:hypothetical protein
MSMKNSSNTIENRTRELSAYSAVSQPTAPSPTSLNVAPVIYSSIPVLLNIIHHTFVKQTTRELESYSSVLTDPTPDSARYTSDPITMLRDIPQ